MTFHGKYDESKRPGTEKHKNDYMKISAESRRD